MRLPSEAIEKGGRILDFSLLQVNQANAQASNISPNPYPDSHEVFTSEDEVTEYKMSLTKKLQMTC